MWWKGILIPLLLASVVCACPELTLPEAQAAWAPSKAQQRYQEIKLDYCLHPVTGKLVPTEWGNAQVLFGAVTNFTGGRIVQLDSPHGLVAVFLNENYRGQNGDEIEWIVRNYGSYTRTLDNGDSETLRMFDDVSMTPEVFMKYYRAGYAFDGRPLSMPGAPDQKILESVTPKSANSNFRSTTRVAPQFDRPTARNARKLDRMPSQFTGERIEIRRSLPSQFDR
jgi:hypothetical protein